MSKSETRHWLYLKLFLSDQPIVDPASLEETVDQLLREHLLPALDSARAAGLCQDYFFLRYAEEGYHMRIRCRCNDAESSDASAACIEAALDAALQARPGILGKPRDCDELKSTGQLQRCAYLPETDKYCGPEGVCVAEAHFGHCTRLVGAALQLCAQGLSKSQLSLWLMGQAVSSLPLQPGEMATVMGGYATFWRKSSLPGQEDVTAILDRNYARKKAGILQFLPAGSDEHHTTFATAHPQVEDLLGSVRDMYSTTLATLCALEDAGKLQSSFLHHLHSSRSLQGHGPNLARYPMSYLLVLPNLLHMMNNRLGLDVLQESQLAHYVSRALCERFAVAETPFEIVLEPSSLRDPEPVPG